jgi:hypothetical protein
MLDPLVYGDWEYDDPVLPSFASRPTDPLAPNVKLHDNEKQPRVLYDGGAIDTAPVTTDKDADKIRSDSSDDDAVDVANGAKNVADGAKNDADDGAKNDADDVADDLADDVEDDLADDVEDDLADDVEDDADDCKKKVRRIGNAGEVDFAQHAKRHTAKLRDSASNSSNAQVRKAIMAEMDDDDIRDFNEFEAMLQNQRRVFEEETKRIQNERKKKRLAKSEKSAVSSVHGTASSPYPSPETRSQSGSSSSSSDDNKDVDVPVNNEQTQLYSTPTSLDLDELCREARRDGVPCICLMGVDEMDAETFQEWNSLCLRAGDVRVVHMECASQFERALPCLCAINAAGRALDIQREWLLYMSHTRTLVQVHVLAVFDDSGALGSVDELPEDCRMLVYDCENARCLQYMRTWVCNESSFAIHILRTQFPCSCIVHRVGEKLLVHNI